MTRIYDLEALTDVWTGDADTAISKIAGRLITTGLLGSIRWWFEVLVRGLGGHTCDPSADRKTCLDRDHCLACELFGCTGWARKFRFDVVNRDTKAIKQSRIRQGEHITLRFEALRAVQEDEWKLLDLTIRLIADYGALGGKTVLKPSQQNDRVQHKDFGLVRCCSTTGTVHLAQLTNYLSHYTKAINDGDSSWASCRHMWSVADRYLKRENNQTSTFNRVIGRPEAKQAAAQNDSWISGSQGESKKVFSFKQPARSFGFVKSVNDLDRTRDTLRAVWNIPPEEDNNWFLFGEAMLNRLCEAKEERS
jgi:CRISPR-associated protein Cmr1